jgi:hypothetical protein
MCDATNKDPRTETFQKLPITQKMRPRYPRRIGLKGAPFIAQYRFLRETRNVKLINGAIEQPTDTDAQ